MSVDPAALSIASNASLESTQEIGELNTPLLDKACEKLTNLFNEKLPKLLRYCPDIIRIPLSILLPQQVENLKENILQVMAEGHKSFETVRRQFCEAEGVAGHLRALKDMVKWALGKGLNVLAFAALQTFKFLAWVNDATLRNSKVSDILNELMNELNAVDQYTFKMTKSSIILSQGSERTEQDDVEEIAPNSNPKLAKGKEESLEVDRMVTTKDEALLNPLVENLKNYFSKLTTTKIPPLTPEFVQDDISMFLRPNSIIGHLALIVETADRVVEASRMSA